MAITLTSWEEFDALYRHTDMWKRFNNSLYLGNVDKGPFFMDGIPGEELSRKFLIHPEMWSALDQRLTNREGWIISCISKDIGVCYISHRYWHGLDTVEWRNPTFTSDLQAVEFVQERASQGSEFHKRAWLAWAKCYMHGSGEPTSDR